MAIPQSTQLSDQQVRCNQFLTGCRQDNDAFKGSDHKPTNRKLSQELQTSCQRSAEPDTFGSAEQLHPSEHQAGRAGGELESIVQDHRHKLKTLDRRHEGAIQKQRQLDLALYNSPEEAEEEKDVDAIASCLGAHDDTAAFVLKVTRLGARSMGHRPVLVNQHNG